MIWAQKPDLTEFAILLAVVGSHGAMILCSERGCQNGFVIVRFNTIMLLPGPWAMGIDNYCCRCLGTAISQINREVLKLTMVVGAVPGSRVFSVCSAGNISPAQRILMPQAAG